MSAEVVREHHPTPTGSIRVRVAAVHPSQFAGWWVEFWECGHGSLSDREPKVERRVCRICTQHEGGDDGDE